MDFILNDESLNGQFKTITEFLDKLEENVKCIAAIKRNFNNKIYKTRDFYECKITATDRICDLKRVNCSDKLQRFQIALDREIYAQPYWDDDDLIAHDLNQKYYLDGIDVTATCIAEAAERNQRLISFFHENFLDKKLIVKKGKADIQIESIYTQKYLFEVCADILNIDRDSLAKIRYENTRVDCSKIDSAYGLNYLDKDEYDQVIATLDKVVKHESWISIGLDDGLEYKKYSPANKKKDWFNGTIYQDKQIMKMRASSVLRIYGYRKRDRFVVLRIETDHKISNYG